MKTVGRVSLYERLWTIPKRDVACEFGVTSDRLSRLCRRNKIPIPLQGFWNRGPQSRSALKVPLPDPEQDWEITVEASAGHVPQELPVRKARIRVPEKLCRPHPLLRQTRSFLRAAEKDAFGRYVPAEGCLHILTTLRCRQRAYRIIDTVLKECEARGWPVAIKAGAYGGTVVRVHGGDVPIMLVESLRFDSRELTDQEREQEETRGRPRRHAMYERSASGNLGLLLGCGNDKGRKCWHERGRFRLEHLLDSFFAGLQEAGKAAKRHDDRVAKAEEEKREADRLRWALEDACREEEKRIKALLEQVVEWAKSENLRRFIRARVARWKAKGTTMRKGSEAGNWLAWAMAQADRLDPLVVNPPSVLDRKPLSFWGLMGAKDDWWKTAWQGRPRF